MWIICTPCSRRWLRIGQMWPPLTVKQYRTSCSPRIRPTSAPPSRRVSSRPGKGRPIESPMLRVPATCGWEQGQRTPCKRVRAWQGGQRCLPVAPMTGRDAILAAFDELFDAAAAKLNAVVTPKDRDEARARFSEHFDKALEVAGGVEMAELPRA